MAIEWHKGSDEYLERIERASQHSIKRSILLIDDVPVIKILLKRGYSWVDTEVGISIDFDNKLVFDSGGEVIVELAGDED